jgi:hypothetical protein
MAGNSTAFAALAGRPARAISSGRLARIAGLTISSALTPVTKATGDEGERFIAEHIPCPNCSKALILLPPSYPPFDVQCSGCFFRAQVKTSQRRPGGRIRGAGWKIMQHVLKAGQMVPVPRRRPLVSGSALI